MLFRSIDKYLRARGAAGPWQIEGCQCDGFLGAVVIPALAEEESLGATLAGLGANPSEILEKFLVLVVVNQREDSASSTGEENRRTLKKLAAGAFDQPGLRLAWIDAASPGRELPLRDGGVGLARKIGFDLALRRLDPLRAEGLLVSLDADTLVRDDYLPAILDHFACRPEGAAVIPFCHQPGETAAEDRAIRRYELYLRSYVLGLSLAGSPYAFHTVGSTIACRVAAYVRAGGMNRRRAGEDFYFLQQLAKTCGVAPLAGTVVRPSARPSARTPFGTGRSVSRLAGGDDKAVTFYHPDAFRILGGWLNLVGAEWEAGAACLLERSGGICRLLPEVLESFGFTRSWGRLQSNHRQRNRLLHAFHGWFDGLRTQQTIRRINASMPPVSPAESISELMEWAGLEPTGDTECQLCLLRSSQGAEKNPAAPFEPLNETLLMC